MTTASVEKQTQQQTKTARRESSDALEGLYKKVGILAVAAAATYVTRAPKPIGRHAKSGER